MEIKQIEHVLEVARTGSISKAAQNLFLSQPNLSYSVKSLEAELGCDIFVRTSRGIQLTDFGQQFLAYARPVYQQFHFLNSICTDILQAHQIVFSISSPSLKFVNNVFIDIYQKYAEENVYFSHKEDSNINILNDVESAGADIGIVIFISFQRKTWSRLIDIKDLEYTKLTDEDPYVIFSEKNPLYYQELSSVSIDQLEPYPFVVAHTDIFYSSGNEATALDYIDGQRKKSKITVSNRACVYDILYKTNAYSICSNNSNAYKGVPAYDKIKAIPLQSPGFQFEIGWIKRRNAELSEVGKDFIFELEQLLS